MSDRGRQSQKKKKENKQVCGNTSNPIYLTERRMDRLKSQRGEGKWGRTRENMCEYHIAWKLKRLQTLAVWREEEKKSKNWGEKKKWRAREEKNVREYQLALGFRTSVADRDGNRQMEGDGPRETVSIWIALDLSLLLEPDTQRDKRK